jgi:transposase
MSTGDRTILGRITKRGNGYLRTLFMQAARVILLRPGKLAEARLRGLARSRRAASAS